MDFLKMLKIFLKLILCYNGFNKFKKFKPKLKIILDNGFHYFYITQL